MSGDLSGDISLVGLHEDAHLDANLTVDRLSVGSVPYKSARVQLEAGGHGVDGLVRIDQTDGFAEVRAHAATSWSAALAPELDPGQPLDASLAAKTSHRGARAVPRGRGRRARWPARRSPESL